MKIENLFSRLTPEKEERESFLALEIGTNFVKSAVWQLKEGKVEVVKTGLRKEWEGQELKELISVCDATLASSTETLAQEPNKVVFGLPETWVKGKKVVEPRLSDLRELCRQLDLEPLGFVVTTEAMIKLFQIQEGAPPSGILVYLGNQEVVLSLVKTGKIIATQAVGRSREPGSDLYEGMARFGQKELPAQIFLYGPDLAALEKAKQKVMADDWEGNSLFLHFPTVEILAEDVDIQAVAISGGQEAVQALGLPGREGKPGKLGFVSGKDVRQQPKEKVEKKPQKAPSKKVSLERLKEVLTTGQKRLRQIQWPSFSFSLAGRLPLVLLLIFIFFLVVTGLSIAGYWYLPKAEVVLYVKPKSLEKEATVIIDPSLSNLDLANNLLPGQEVTAKMKKEGERETSGEKLVGDRATGEVTVYNLTADAKSFKKGTAIVGPDNLQFTFTSDILVASASSEFDEDWNKVTVPGKTKVAVTASQIGPEYNLASGSEFSLKGFSSSDYRAKNEKAFSGGSSRKVKVVSASDQEKLLSELTEELEKAIVEELIKKAPKEKKIVEESILTSVVGQEFDQAVGTEADKLKLSLEMKAKTLAYSPAELEVLAEEILSGSVSPDFVLKETKKEIKEGKIKEDGSAEVKIHFQANLIPKLDLAEIKKNLKGKYPSLGEEYLGSLPNFVKAEIEITPNLPARLRTFPHLTKNIHLKVEGLE